MKVKTVKQKQVITLIIVKIFNKFSDNAIMGDHKLERQGN